MSTKFDELYLDIAERVAEMSHARRAKVGAVIVKGTNILSFGYNGTPSGRDNNCEEEVLYDYGNRTGEYRLKTKEEVLHAESNAIAKVAMSTQSSEGATIYVTMSPCLGCAKMIIQSGIKRVVFREKYREDSPITLLKECGIEVEQIA